MRARGQGTAVRRKSNTTDLFLRILQRNDARIRRIARKHAAPDDFCDLHQEILLQIWRSLNSYKAMSELDTWVYRVALNTARDFKRKARRRQAESPADSVRPRSGLPHFHAPVSQSRMLKEFAESLPESDRVLFSLLMQGLTNRQMSEVTGLDQRHIRVKLSRIKRIFLKKYIEK